MAELQCQKLPYVLAHRLVRTVAITEIPGRSFVAKVESASAILTGTRCTTFVKLPVALSGGNRANCDPLAGAISTTLARMSCPGYSSIRISAGSPTFTLVNCVSRKFACTHLVRATNEITCVPGETSCPGLT